MLLHAWGLQCESVRPAQQTSGNLHAVGPHGHVVVGSHVRRSLKPLFWQAVFPNRHVPRPQTSLEPAG
jgi:hypothetical protein